MMLRRRRSVQKKANAKDDRRKRLLRDDKLKMSPLPEEETGDDNQPPLTSSLRNKLQFDDNSTVTPLEDVSNQSTARKSRRRSKRRSMFSESELPSAKKDRPAVNGSTNSTMIRSMWEHAMTFMRGALDAILFDRSKAESVVSTPIASDGVCLQESPDPVLSQSPASGGEATPLICSKTDSLKQSPPTPGTCSVYCTPYSPTGWPSSIKHPALKRYYEDSPESMVQNTKSFSSLLQERAKVAANGLNCIAELESAILTPTHQKLSDCQSLVVPAPPPLPPIAPIPPPLPPATPTASDIDGQAPPPDKYSAVLHSMQNRLQKRIKNRGVAAEHDKQVTTDVKLQHWAEIQCHGEKMSADDFLKLANQKRLDFVDTLKELAQSRPLSQSQVEHITDVVHAAPHWYPGSTKEIRDTVAGYKEIEKKIEAMIEFVQVSQGMKEAIEVPVSLDAEFSKLRDDFLLKYKVWIPIISTNASTWRKYSLPVDDGLLQLAQCHFLRLAQRMMSTVHRESVKIDGILLSLKCFRTTTVKQQLMECLDVLIKALDVWGDKDGRSMRQSANEDINCLKENVLLTAHAFIHISLGQFDGFVCMRPKQEVMSHFEEILKVIGLIKTFVMKCDAHVTQLTGYITSLPASEELGTVLHASCSKLIEHIITQSGVVMETGDASSRNIVLWMMFGCKYVNRVLEFLGADRADEQGMGDLLAGLEQVENAL